MPAPIRVPLSEHQRQVFADLRADAQGIVDRQNAMVTSIIAHDHNPKSFVGWSIALTDAEIVCTPPAEEARA